MSHHAIHLSNLNLHSINRLVVFDEYVDNAHHNQQVALYYVNLEWRDGWHGETVFYNPDKLNEIAYASLFVPGRIILFDGSIPHAIRPQSIKAPKFRFTVSLFFD